MPQVHDTGVRVIADDGSGAAHLLLRHADLLQESA